MKPRILDLFCGAGGAGMGYHLAGFEVVGVDINPQPRYPFEFHQGDALVYLREHGHEFDAIHSSPPCQAHSSLTALTSTKTHCDMIPATRWELTRTGKAWVIENVPGAPLVSPVQVCGTAFGLKVARHRMFESNVALTGTGACSHKGKELYTVLTKSCRVIGDMRGPSSHQTGKAAMGVDWMTQMELGEAIPPAYTEFLGLQLRAALMLSRAA